MPDSSSTLPQEAVTKIYDRNAPFYDVMEAPMEWLAFGRWRSELFRGVRGRVLELGVGTGHSLPHYPREGVELTAVDVSSAMLERVERHASNLGIEVDIVQADIRDLPFATASFDVVVSACVFCSVADPVEGLRQAHRVLRSGGELRMLEHQRPDGPRMASLFDLLNPVAVRVSGANINRETQHNVERTGFAEVYARRTGPFGVVRLITARKA